VPLGRLLAPAEGDLRGAVAEFGDQAFHPLAPALEELVLLDV
jgi:hypothetical protein